MKSQSIISIAFVVALSLLVGCNSSDPGAPIVQPGGESTEPVMEDSETPSPSGSATISPVFKREGSDTAAPPRETTEPQVEPQAESSEPSEPAEENMDRVKADVGVAKAGRSLDEYEGVVVTPAKSLFAVQERMVFQAQIPSALKLYEASNGNKPKSHEEFMTKIIQANQIRLPELPAGQRYAWDPEQGELMVEKPK